jgi:tRNA (uracil-5-)-methyltransferase TRM9
MRDDVIKTLRRVNESFYQTFAAEFSATRERLQPGVLRALQAIPGDANILDLGCGNGELARRLFHDGHHGMYIGLDISETMLEHARERAADSRARFLAVDLNKADWTNRLYSEFPDLPPTFDRALAFAVLHHIPGSGQRLNLVQTVGELLPPQGAWLVSVWDFLASERLRERILPWEVVGLKPSDVEPGDSLVDWRRGGSGRRYVHHFTPESLAKLAGEGGFEVSETYRSDGENGRLGLYQVWLRV